MNKLLTTASFHITKPCNFGCKYCYATFNDMRVKMMSLQQAKRVIDELARVGVEKITFAGGEPMLHPNLSQMIIHAKNLGMVTSIITNGSMLTREFLSSHVDDLDWIGVSIDSVDPITNKLIGRKPVNEHGAGSMGYGFLVKMIKSYGYKLKINTVVNYQNVDETLVDFINEAQPDRWKVFQALPIKCQNDEYFGGMEIDVEEFEDYVTRNAHPAMVPENNDLMTGSYLLIDPQGRLFENSKGTHTYSRSLFTYKFEDCYKELDFSFKQFIARGGVYNW